MINLDVPTAASVVGTKAASLMELRAQGEMVPDGFVIPVGSTGGLDRAGLGDALARLGNARVAVRSSAIAEDLAHESHAGRYLTVLDVPAQSDAVAAATTRVVASGDGTAMAVLVQTMVEAVAAGAAFSANPVTGDDEVVVSAVPGLADTLMAGEAAGGRWTVDYEGSVHGSGDVDDSVIGAVAGVVRRLAERRGHPVDMEWAYDGDMIFVVQCRPITALPVAPTLEYPAGSWQKDATHHPAPLRPLVASCTSRDVDAVARWTERAGLLIAGLEQRSIGGEIYVRPVPLMGGSGKPPPAWMLGLVARLHPALRRRMAAASRFVSSRVFTDPATVWKEWKAQLRSEIAELRAVDLTDLDDVGLREHIDLAIALGGRAAEMHFDLFLPYGTAIRHLTVACERMLGWDHHSTMSLMAGHSTASSEPVIALRRVVDAAAEAGVVDRLRAGDTEWLAAAPQAARLLDEWLEEHGFRTVNYDWSSPTIAEQPGLVDAMLRAEASQETRRATADDAESQARSLLDPDDVAEFDRLLDAARAVFNVREDNVQWTVLVPGALLRRAFLEVGNRLAERNVVRNAADVFFLEYGEAICALTRGSEPLHEEVRRRRAERAWVEAHPGPLQLGEASNAMPDLSALPEAGRSVNETLLWAIGAEFTPVVDGARGDGVIRGVPGGAGRYTGVARIVRTEADFARVQPGDVVVCPITNPAWSVLFSIAGAFVCDSGGPLSHTAVLCREFAIPSVLATGEATKRIADGAVVTVDGAAGTLTMV
jgi:pyruvate,water dikinase